MPDLPSTKERLARAARLAKRADEIRSQRDDEIRDCCAVGIPLRTIGDATGLSHAAIARIRDR